MGEFGTVHRPPPGRRLHMHAMNLNRNDTLMMHVRSLLPSSIGVFLLLAVGALPAQAQLRPAPELQEPFFAWDEGRYVDAMEGYLSVLRGSDGARHVREAALLTGELHPVRAVDDDGRSLRISPDSRYLAWSRQIEGHWVTRIEPVAGGARTELPGQDIALSATGRVAYFADGRLTVRDLASGSEASAEADGLRLHSLALSPDGGSVFLAAGREGTEEIGLYRATAPGWRAEALEVGAPVVVDPAVTPDGRYLVFTVPARSPFAPRGAGAGLATGGPRVGVLDLRTGAVETWEGSAPSVSRNSALLAWRVEGADGAPGRIMGARLGPDADERGDAAGSPAPRVLLESTDPLAFPAPSPDGSRVAFQARPHTDWEIFVVASDGSSEAERVTREIQHDQFPLWSSDRLLVAMKGEGRHRRSYGYPLSADADAAGSEGYRLFHNNTLRTIAPEYDWVASPDGRGIFVSAERDGNTISPERAVWWVDLTREVTREALVARLEENLARERDLLERGRAAFAPLADEVAEVSAAVSAGRVFHYANALYGFGSKFVTQPGNARAIEYLRETLESWGYDVELQWFTAGGRGQGARSANVVATLTGTESPDLVYVISSHFDSVERGPGADDNSSGTTALLEAARVLAERPRSATIQFAFLTGEEAGLLGAREFVRRAVEEGKQVAGVLNNDMIGWTRSHRLDNTIRYSNPGIKDIQHAASHFFSELVTYDALYYRSTDAGVFYQQYGDVVGGIGSYPVLGNPNYHQVTDQIETIDHRLVAEVSRTTVATIMLLADSPARLEGIEVVSADGGSAEIRWEPAREAGVREYRVRYGVPGSAEMRTLTVREPRVRLSGVPAGAVVEVKGVNPAGLAGWDWARVDLAGAGGGEEEAAGAGASGPP